jgi:ketosteroid isomerase-like protein
VSEQELIQSFYTSFQQRDWKGMQACYHDRVVFSDPVFPHLEGAQAKAMWHMLTTSARELDITFSHVTADARQGSCDWEARYPFSKTGRRVHNRIHASFEFLDGKIIRHTDQFDLAKWAGMAFGLTGMLLGRTSWMQNKIRSTARASLLKFMANHPEYGAPK